VALLKLPNYLLAVLVTQTVRLVRVVARIDLGDEG